MLRSLVLAMAAGTLLMLVACSPPPAAPARAALSVPVAWAPKPPPVGLIDEVLRTFELGARAGKGGWPKALPPLLLNNPALDAAYATFASLRNGDKYDQVVAKVACFGMNQGPASTSSPVEQEWESRIYAFFPQDFQRGTFLSPPGDYNVLIKSQVTRAAQALAVAQQSPGGVAWHYARYCL